MSNIHDYHRGLPPEDTERLNEAAGGQEQRVLGILRAAPTYHFAYFEIIERTGYDKDSAKRALSNLSGSAAHERYLDQFGNWPVVYRSGHRKRNPNTGTTCGIYRANPIYGIRPARGAENDPAGQADMFGPPKPKHRSGVML